jgi:hypothetical protein
MREAVDLETYGDPLAWQIRSELYIINEVAKGTLITNDKKILDLLEVKLDNLDNEFKPVNFTINNQLQVKNLNPGTTFIGFRKVEYKDGKLSIIAIKDDGQEFSIDSSNIDEKNKGKEKWEELERKIEVIKGKEQEIIDRIKREYRNRLKEESRKLIEKVEKEGILGKEYVKEVKIKSEGWQDNVDIDKDGVIDQDYYKHLVSGEIVIEIPERGIKKARKLEIPFTLVVTYKLEYFTNFSCYLRKRDNKLSNIKVVGYPRLKVVKMAIYE